MAIRREDLIPEILDQAGIAPIKSTSVASNGASKTAQQDLAMV
jgi:hypothetical protein